MHKIEKSFFWADQTAGEILQRKKFHYIDRPVPKFSKYVVKTAASLSGVLHIGRLSDTIRCDSVYRSLKERGKKSSLIWVADDMDPLRKIPKGVPGSYSKYIGVPVTDIPDPSGCHKSYGEHHISEYLQAVNMFVSGKMRTYSMREEYKKGSFRKEIQKIIHNRENIIDIQNRYRPEGNKLGRSWFPWAPICENCGKIITTRFLSFDGNTVKYECRDYRFAKYAAKGCGYRGENDPREGNGKLFYKGELAMQWAHWSVVSEGFGKEYQVPGSAFWINAEISEKVLGFPAPVPVFYEHILIDGEKMSASRGNVIYPADWLKVAPPELLRFLYNKKLMKTRNFSWGMLPALYDEYDRHEMVYFGKKRIDNESDRNHMKRLYEISQISVPAKISVHIPFDFAVMVSQIFPEKNFQDALRAFQSTGHLGKKPSDKDKEAVRIRLFYARNWAKLYAPEQYRIKLVEKLPEEAKKLSSAQKASLKEVASLLESKRFSQDELHSLFWDISKKFGISSQEFFSAAYVALLGKTSGPKLAPFILAVGQKKVAELLRQIE